MRLPQLAHRLSLVDGGNGLDSVRDWTSMLSLGEQQRLGFARLLVAFPRLYTRARTHTLPLRLTSALIEPLREPQPLLIAA